MKPTVSNSCRFTFGMVSTAIVSIFWVMAGNEASTAQVNLSQKPDNYKVGLGGLLPVPQSPLAKNKTVLPPPPGVSTGVAVAPPLPTFPKQHSATDDIKQLENAFIQGGVTGKAPSSTKHSHPSAAALLLPQRQTNPPLVAAGEDSSSLGINQGTANFPTANQEFTAPQTSPTFNQVLNQNQKTSVAPLPPLPGTVASQPTFNQVLTGNAQPSAMSANPGTFNQVLNTTNGTSPPLPRSDQPHPPINNMAVMQPSAFVQGVYVTQGSDSSARARVSGVYPLTANTIVGATLDLTTANSTFVDSRQQGASINELYIATSLPGLPNLRFAVGQLDLTSYFDRNSFAKDGATQFFNPLFQTNAALAVTGISSHPALLANWSVTDNIDAKAAIFSSSNSIGNFSLDGFAGEVGIRYGNAIIRGTYASDRDGGNHDSFRESFQISRGNNQFGPLENDREEAYGVNAEAYVPNLKLGFFGRYGRYEDRTLNKGASTYIFGASLVDLFTRDDRLGLAYGQQLSNSSLSHGKYPDVLEAYYDFKFLPNLRLGFSVQGRDSFQETVFGVRLNSEFNVTPIGRNNQ